MIRVGYVGINTMLLSPNKTFRLSGYSDERMIEVARANISALQAILQWNKEHNVHIFRLTSQLIPLGSHPINSGSWKKVLAEELHKVGEYVKENNIKLSMHPGQYTVINALNNSYYENAIRDLQYHADVLTLMGLDKKHRFVVHGGGAYGDKEASLKRLRERILQLPESIYERLMIENDDVIFTAEEILQVCLDTKIPAVIDTFHHEVLPSMGTKSIREIILAYKKSWPDDERQKIQYSNQNPEKSKGAHSQTIDIDLFGAFYQQVKDLEIDIMLEVKDKEQSVLNIRKQFLDFQ
jgi:UV DNA damage endonuclease